MENIKIDLGKNENIQNRVYDVLIVGPNGDRITMCLSLSELNSINIFAFVEFGFTVSIQKLPWNV